MREDRKNLIFLLSCNNTKKEVNCLKNVSEIVSIYHVCGINPLLIVYKAASIDDAITLSREHQKLNIKYMSLLQALDKPKIFAEPEEKEASQPKSEIIFWIFIKASFDDQRFKDFIKKAKAYVECKETNLKFEITELYKEFGESNFVVKVCTSNVNGVDTFLKRIREKGMSSSPKCVLSTIKESGGLLKNGITKKHEDSRKIKKEQEYAIARVMANEKDFIKKKQKDQITFLEKKLKDMAIPHDNIKNYIVVTDTEEKYGREDLIHRNKLIDRYSTKLEREEWLKVLFFFEAASGKNDELEEVLKKELLGVKLRQFSRKLYQLTGDYDFLVPFDCTNMEALNKVINDFAKDHGPLITRFTNTVCWPEDKKMPSHCIH